MNWLIQTKASGQLYKPCKFPLVVKKYFLNSVGEEEEEEDEHW